MMFLAAVSLLGLPGCASYTALPLENLSIEIVPSQSDSSDLLVIGKAFTEADCKRYLDRNVLAEGYQPVQLYLQNNSSKTYIFSLNRLSLSCVSHELVAEKVHTSTVGRAVG